MWPNSRRWVPPQFCLGFLKQWGFCMILSPSITLKRLTSRVCGDVWIRGGDYVVPGKEHLFIFACMHAWHMCKFVRHTHVQVCTGTHMWQLLLLVVIVRIIWDKICSVVLQVFSCLEIFQVWPWLCLPTHGESTEITNTHLHTWLDSGLQDLIADLQTSLEPY